MRRIIVAAAVAAFAATACASTAERARGSAEVIPRGIFPNLTHAPGYVALGSGLFEENMAPTRVDVTVFNSGSEAGEALLAGAIDATYIGPGPAAQLYVQSGGRVAVVSGAVSGGASFVVRRGAGISSPQDLHGTKIADPGFGNTQDVALRTWLADQGLQTRDEGGDVAVVEVDNPELPQLFRAGQIDGAWEPEPYPSLLIHEGLADQLVDEATLWPDGRFATTNLLVSTAYMDAHPEIVQHLVDANLAAIEQLNDDPEGSKRIVLAQLIQAGAPSLDQEVVDAAWDRLQFTWDPIAPSLIQGAQRAYDLGYLDEQPADLDGLYRLAPLNAALAEGHLDPVKVVP